MLPTDIETSDAIALLSRRRFLQAMGATGVGIAVANFDALAAEAAPIGPRDGVLVVLTLAGGNDGLSTVPPIGVGAYYDTRKGLALRGAAVNDIGNGFGMHAGLPYLRSLYNDGHVAIINGVGLTGSSLSHFDAMATWMRGTTASGSFTGWLGRWLDASGPSTPLLAASIDTNVPLTLTGTQQAAAAVSPWGMEFGSSAEEHQQRVYQFVREVGGTSTGLGVWGDAIAATHVQALDVGRDVSPIYKAQLPENQLAKKLAVAARLISANVGTRVLHIFHDGYDTHSNQLTDHNRLMGELNEGLSAFFGNLAPAFAARTSMLVVSEFGRTPKPNSNGTDHGTANTTFLIGRPVAGGIYGALPSFTDLDRDRRFKPALDFRSVYATVLEGVLGADSRQILGGNFERMNLFSGAAPSEIPAPPPIPNAAGRYIAINPERRLDTRIGLGHPRAKMGQAVEHTVIVGGVGSVPPTGVSAVVVNVTVDGPTEPSWLAVWPTGEKQPVASNLNFGAGQTIPNLVLAKMGVNNRISFHLHQGRGDVIADVVGYYSTTGGSGFMPMSPVRINDTRLAAKLGPKQTLDVQVTGVAGVPAAGVSAVALNVTVTEPSEAGWLTVFPTGEVRPVASSLNFRRGQTIPNLVMAKVGANGKVSIYNDSGSVHVVVDINGWFAADGSGSRAVPVTPLRLIDTRTSQVVGPDATLEVKVTGAAGVPANAKAVALNVTAVNATQWTFVTAWPTGQPRPNASNLNVEPGGTIPNQVVAAIGSGGKVSLWNAFGNVHLIADIIGYYT